VKNEYYARMKEESKAKSEVKKMIKEQERKVEDLYAQYEKKNDK